MDKTWLLALTVNVLIFLKVPREVAGFGVDFNIGNGGPGVGVWIGGGVTAPAVPSGSTYSTSNSAYNALQAWKSAITSDPHNVLSTWVGSDVCSYKGVFCGTRGGNGFQQISDSTVVGIDLNRADLEGTLVSDLSVLGDLSLIHLNGNRFKGTVPESFSLLGSLRELDLSDNRLSGPFPIATLSMPSLIYLDLRFNGFAGPIPEALFSKKLDAIFLNDNNFDGNVPQTLAYSPASVINLANNKLTGSLPVVFGLMNAKVKEVLLLNNQLTGCIPEQIGLFSDMQVFDVSYNSLMGHLPNAISCLNQLEVLNLEHNMLSGELPDVICSLRSLLNFTVSFNFFSKFSQQCEKLLFRNVGFDVSDNCIPGRDMQRPSPECSGIPGGSLSCLRIPSVQPLVCGSLFAGLNEKQSSLSP